MLAHHEIAHSLTARYLSTSMDDAEAVSSQELAGTAATRLGQRYDQAPVRHGSEVVGFALTSELADAPRRRVVSVMHPVSAATTVTRDTTIRDVLPVLRDHRFAFVQDDGQPLSGFIAPSDLNKQAGRAYFYLLIAALEISIAELIRDNSTLDEQASYLTHLPSDGRFAVECRYLVDQRSGVEVDYVSYMEFTHLLKIAGRLPQFRGLMGAASSSSWEKAVGGLPQLRNDVMHSTREFLSPTRTIDALIRYEKLVEGILVRLQTESSRLAQLP